MKTESEIHAIEKAMEQGSADLDDLFALGDAYFAEGRHLDLLDLCDRMTAMPLSALDQATVLSYEGVTHVCLCQWEAATEAFVRSLSMLENTSDTLEEVVSLKGLNYYDLSLYCQDEAMAMHYSDQALKYLTILTRSFPDYPHMSKVFAHIADLYNTNGDLDQALVYYGLFFESCQDPEDRVWALSGMATVFASLEKPEKALELYNEALQVSDSKALMSKVYYDLGELYYRFENMGEARTAMKTALRYRGQDPILRQNREYEISIQWRLGTIAFDQEDEKTMLALFGHILGQIDSNHNYYADINLRLGHYYDARCQYSRASKHYNEVLLSPMASVEETVTAKDSLATIPLKAPCTLH